MKATKLDHHKAATKTYCAHSSHCCYKVLTSFDRVLFTWTHHHFSSHRRTYKIIFLFSGFSGLAFNKLLVQPPRHPPRKQSKSKTFQYLRHFGFDLRFGFRISPFAFRFLPFGPTQSEWQKKKKLSKKIMKNDAANVHKKFLRDGEKTLSLLRFVSAS